MFTETIAALRPTDRKALLRHLGKLGSLNPEQRAKAALAADTLLQDRGVTWAALLRIGPDAADDMQFLEIRVPPKLLAARPDISASDRAFALKLTRWKSPGADGLVRLREVAGRVGLDLD